jgi:hypothetical protein
MKKSASLPEKNCPVPEVSHSDIHEKISRDILKELEIPERTQKPPSAELITKLNEIASKPPFSYFHKAKDNDTR